MTFTASDFWWSDLAVAQVGAESVADPADPIDVRFGGTGQLCLTDVAAPATAEVADLITWSSRRSYWSGRRRRGRPGSPRWRGGQRRSGRAGGVRRG